MESQKKMAPFAVPTERFDIIRGSKLEEVYKATMAGIQDEGMKAMYYFDVYTWLARVEAVGHRDFQARKRGFLEQFVRDFDLHKGFDSMLAPRSAREDAPPPDPP